jgi:hypothetical protein
MVAFAVIHHKTSLINIEDPLKLFIRDDGTVIVIGKNKTQLYQVFLPIVKATFDIEISGPPYPSLLCIFHFATPKFSSSLFRRRTNNQCESHSITGLVHFSTIDLVYVR